MIQIPMRPLPPDLQRRLDELQAALDACPTYAERVEEAQRRWEGKPRAQFLRIKEELVTMCAGVDRCMYCEERRPVAPTWLA